MSSCGLVWLSSVLSLRRVVVPVAIVCVWVIGLEVVVCDLVEFLVVVVVVNESGRGRCRHHKEVWCRVVDCLCCLCFVVVSHLMVVNYLVPVVVESVFDLNRCRHRHKEE